MTELTSRTRNLMISLYISPAGVDGRVYQCIRDLVETVFGEAGVALLTKYVDATDDCFYVTDENAATFLPGVMHLEPLISG